MKSGLGSKIIPIGPEKLDSNIRFSSIGGLDSHVQCLKEMIVLPMMYPDVFRQFQIQPPKGVLFHGPPGNDHMMLFWSNTLYGLFCRNWKNTLSESFSQ